MSGHSKWSQIKHQKGAADVKRGKIFTKLGHAITIAAREGGGNIAMNPRLALAVEMAKKNNMPKENVDRAIKRGTGELGGAAVESILYEAYGPGGTAILIQTMTDNRNRTVNEIRSIANKFNGKLAESGSVAYLFRQRGAISIDMTEAMDEAVELAIIEAGAEDYEQTETELTVFTDAKSLNEVKNALEAAGMRVSNAELRYEPNQVVEITDKKVAEQIIRLMTGLEELDDVAEVVGNFSIDDDLI